MNSNDQMAKRNAKNLQICTFCKGDKKTMNTIQKVFKNKT